jgi:hypothetical protein
MAAAAIMAAGSDEESPGSDEDVAPTGIDADVVSAGGLSVCTPVRVKLADGEAVVRGPYHKHPVLMSGLEDTGLLDTESVLSGGYLRCPVLLRELVFKDGKKFYKLQKWIPHLCLFLAGKLPR